MEGSFHNIASLTHSFNVIVCERKGTLCRSPRVIIRFWYDISGALPYDSVWIYVAFKSRASFSFQIGQPHLTCPALICCMYRTSGPCLMPGTWGYTICFLRSSRHSLRRLLINKEGSLTHVWHEDEIRRLT